MENNIKVFNFNENEVRTNIDENGEVWFVNNDVCNVLDIKNPRDAFSSLDDDEKCAVGSTDTLGGKQMSSTMRG